MADQAALKEFAWLSAIVRYETTPGRMALVPPPRSPRSGGLQILDALLSQRRHCQLRHLPSLRSM